mgnify:CR=1 FL=1
MIDFGWPGCLYAADAHTNNSWEDRGDGNVYQTYVQQEDESKGWDAQVPGTAWHGLAETPGAWAALFVSHRSETGGGEPRRSRERFVAGHPQQNYDRAVGTPHG